MSWFKRPGASGGSRWKTAPSCRDRAPLATAATSARPANPPPTPVIRAVSAGSSAWVGHDSPCVSRHRHPRAAGCSRTCEKCLWLGADRTPDRHYPPRSKAPSACTTRASPLPRRKAEASGKQPPVTLGDDFHAAIGHPDGGLVVDRIRRRRDPRGPLFGDGAVLAIGVVQVRNDRKSTSPTPRALTRILRSSPSGKTSASPDRRIQ